MKEVHGKDDKVPGDDPTLKQKVLAMGNSLLGKFDPINNICNHVVGFHCYSGEVKRQLIAHHFCSMLSQEFRQCIVYDSDKSDAKLIGIEYIISDRLFKTLPEEEKKYWHSHVFEIKGGLLTCPRLPTTVENTVMDELIHTYGKTIHLWQIDRGDTLPLGEPKLMMALTEESQVNQDIIRKRDELQGIKIQDVIRARADIQSPTILPGADAWAKGKATIFESKEVNNLL